MMWSIFLYLIVSFSATTSFFLASPQKLQAILYCFTELTDIVSASTKSRDSRSSAAFYVSDGNAFAALLFVTAIHFVFLVYVPYFIRWFFLYTSSARTFFERSVSFTFLGGVVFYIFFAFFRNHYDLARARAYWFSGVTTNNLFAETGYSDGFLWQNRRDLSSWRSQYWGDFVDLAFILLAWLVFQFSLAFSATIVSSALIKTRVYGWIFRCVVYLFILYFFCGEGFVHDSIVFIVGFILSEIFILFWRFLHYLSFFKSQLKDSFSLLWGICLTKVYY